MTPRMPTPAALLFDMDGTLTRPMLDFDAIRAEIGIRGPILEAIRHLAPEAAALANAILDRHERRAAEESELNDGCTELYAWVAERSLPTALITRNSRSSVDIVLARHGLRFDAIVTRNDAPPKPDPEPLWRACRAIGVEASQAWMVGDGSHDIEAAAASGIASVWVSHGQPRAFDAAPTLSVNGLRDLLKILSCET